MKNEQITERSERICEWFETHPEFKINGMCTKLGVNSSNFYVYLRLKRIPEKLIQPIEDFLANYGYGNPVMERNKSIPPVGMSETVRDDPNGLRMWQGIAKDIAKQEQDVVDKAIDEIKGGGRNKFEGLIKKIVEAGSEIPAEAKTPKEGKPAKNRTVTKKITPPPAETEPVNLNEPEPEDKTSPEYKVWRKRNIGF